MNLFSVFVLLSLAVELAIAEILSLADGSVAAVGFYSCLAFVAYIRGSIAINWFRPSGPVVGFTLVMLVTVAFCSFVAIHTAYVWLVVRYDTLSYSDILLYNFFYDFSPVATLVLTGFEVLSLALRSGRSGGTSDLLAGNLRSFFAFPSRFIV